ncbi:protein ARV1 [Tribolium madens]|uniref:protein ARV1 n=1 Tax=Tribolium madens TaxID=41895 RepID=UPI001CF7655B|nr:protein ARV1 [Tribolium madens]
MNLFIFDFKHFFRKMWGTTSEKRRKYICVNCGTPIKSLYKKYSATVLKLRECEFCHNVADKYLEYDIVIIAIDLVLLQRTAYRHILFNLEFKNFWKLSVILLLMEAYSELMRNSPQRAVKNDEEEKLFLNEFNEMTDFLFYKLSFSVALKTATFMSVLHFLTKIYCKVLGKNVITFMMMWKTLTISSFGTFLLLPSLIWDTSVQEVHLAVVSLFTTMSQLLAYTVVCNCPKLWSITAIFCAYYCKVFCFDIFQMIVTRLT